MHNSFYFLRPLSQALDKRLAGYRLVSCFSQNKDELVIEFNNSQDSFFIKASLSPEFSCLSFPSTFHRARRNSVDIFNGLLMKQVLGTRSFQNERSFALLLAGDQTLVFKMHGARSNVLLFTGEDVQEVFRNSLEADWSLKLSSMDRFIDWSVEEFERNQDKLAHTYFTFGKPVWRHLESRGFSELPLLPRWKLFNEVHEQLESPVFSIEQGSSGISFSLLPSPGARTYADPVVALNDFYYAKTSTEAYAAEKGTLLATLRKRLNQSEAYRDRCLEKLEELKSRHSYSKQADLIMANLHRIVTGAEKIKVEDFYNDNRLLEIKLNRELTPQKNAEVYYRKSKNQVIEVKTLEGALTRKLNEIHELGRQIDSLLNAADLTEVRRVATTLEEPKQNRSSGPTLPYHEHTYKGFVIRVGRNAIANDDLTLHHTHKDDLWLHAKDVAGSHVVIQHQSGKTFPRDVIEYAASLAAYHSKRKNESLCPVAFTARKYVRKRKGDPAGSVVVEREEVILVEPLRK